MNFNKKKFEYIKKRNVFFLIFFTIIFFAMDRVHFIKFTKTSNYVYIVKPTIWIIVTMIIVNLPRVNIKTKIRYRNKLWWWVVYLSSMQLIIYFMGGMVDGLGKSPYNTSIVGILNNIFVFGSCILGQELLRSYILNTLSEKNKNLKILIITILICIFSSNLTIIFTEGFNRNSLIYFSSEVLPKIAIGFVASYFVILGGALYSITYLSIIQLSIMILPVLPNMKWTTKTLLGILSPLIVIFIFQNIYSIITKEKRKTQFKKENYKTLLLTGSVSLFIIWFSIGIFPIYPSIIVTGSMKPKISPGDMVISKRIKGNKAKLNDIIHFKDDNIYVFHRIINIKNNRGKTNFITKGDNNREADFGLLKSEDIRGKVIFVIPKIGWPTLILKDKKNEDTKEKREN
ncbi:MAG: signal peptidase I [Clostridiales bacterium]